MKKALIGAGGHANEVKAHLNDFELISFVENGYFDSNNPNLKLLDDFNPYEYEVMIAIGDPILRLKIKEKLPKETKFFSYIHPTSLILDNKIKIGDGAFIGAFCVITTNVVIGNHCLINRSCHIGHDCIIGDYFSSMPGAIVSGNVDIGNCVYMGTNSSIKQKIKISNDITIGMNACVVNDITETGTYVGVPAKKIK